MLLARKQPQPSHRPLLAVAAATLAGATAAGWLLARAWKSRSTGPSRASEGLAAGAAILCVSVALDSAVEHYRGRYRDPAMFIGPSVAAAGIAVAVGVALQPQRAIALLPKIAFVAVGAVGLAGLGFHAYNILKRPGEISFLNLFYAAPAGAPAALTLAGLYGLIAGELLVCGDQTRSILGKCTAGLISLSLLGTATEAGLLHFRGSFQDPAMYLPVTIPPAAALGLGAAAVTPQAVRFAEPLLKASAVLGMAGPVFHAYGIHRNMGGWRNWSQMILQGPPLPAPPAFLGIAVAGLGVLPLLGEPSS